MNNIDQYLDSEASKSLNKHKVAIDNKIKLAKIKKAIDNGKRVVDEPYEIIKDSNGKYLIKCHTNGTYVGLTGLKGTKYENTPNHNLDTFKIID